MRIIDYREADIDKLASFYDACEDRGIINNASYHAMIGCLENEPEFNMLLLVNDKEQIVGSCGYHKMTVFPVPDAYRICVRTCVLTDLTDQPGMVTLNRLRTGNYSIAKYFLPEFIKRLGGAANMYISSHQSPHASHRLVHQIWCPTLHSAGLLAAPFKFMYRGLEQHFWRLNVPNFLASLKGDAI